MLMLLVFYKVIPIEDFKVSEKRIIKLIIMIIVMIDIKPLCYRDKI